MFISTGISPIHSFTHAHPEIDYTLLHGIHHKEEAYEKESYNSNRYILCTSGVLYRKDHKCDLSLNNINQHPILFQQHIKN